MVVEFGLVVAEKRFSVRLMSKTLVHDDKFKVGIVLIQDIFYRITKNSFPPVRRDHNRYHRVDLCIQVGDLLSSARLYGPIRFLCSG